MKGMRVNVDKDVQQFRWQISVIASDILLFIIEICHSSDFLCN